jgi:hypothetical protein
MVSAQDQRIQYGTLRQKVEIACRIAGVSLPQPSNLAPMLSKLPGRHG